MKKIELFELCLMAISLVATSSCKKSEGGGPSGSFNDKISQYVLTWQNGNPSTTNIAYDAQGRNAGWTYSNIDFSRQESIGSRTLKYQYILNSQGLVSEAYTQTPQQNFRRKFTYDEQKRITRVTQEEQFVNNNGTPNTNMQLSHTYDFTWDGQSNVTSVKMTYSDAYYNSVNTGGVKYYVYTWSGFSAGYSNTLKLANVGLDFFGPYGYHSNLIDGGGNSVMLYGPYFMGKQLPTSISYQGYDSNNNLRGTAVSYGYTYEKDSKGRITMYSNDGESYRFSYQ